MKPLYTKEQFDLAKSKDKLSCQCYYCEKEFSRTKADIKSCLLGNPMFTLKYCSKMCNSNSQKNKISIKCSNCDNIIKKKPSDVKKSKSGNVFCSRSCRTTYLNKHKTHGTRRSKLEIYIEEQLTMLYPELEIHFNRKDTIASELDIYIPSLNIAFELNGIFHYEPIYGINKLDQIQNNDISKSKACFDAKIDLCIIDTSQQKYFKESTSHKYLDIIINIINERLLTS